MTPHASPQGQTAPLPLRIRIGVTGHRELSDPEAVVASATAVLRRIREDVADLLGPDVTYTVVSSLAEGADRLVAEAALREFGAHGATLESILPMAASEYVGDFDSAESQADFANLLSSARQPFAVVSETGSRDEAYELAGRHVVDTSDVLVAAWDGEPARGRGGTGEIVGYARRHGVPVCVAWPGQAAAGPTEDSGASASLAALQEAARRFAEYNDVDIRSGPVADLLHAERDRYAEAVGDTKLHWQCERVSEWALPYVARADDLALRYQRRYYRLGETLFGASALAVTAVTAQWLFDPHGNTGTWIEVALMLLLLVGLALGRRARVHDRWLGYRSLAEALRGAQFIALTGVPDPNLADVGLDAGGSRSAWFQRAFSEVWRGRPHLPYEDDDAPELGRVLVDVWITPQIDYHRAAVKRFAVRHSRLTAAVFVLFAITFLVALLHGTHAAETDPWPDVFVLLAIMLPSFGAALTGIRDQRQFRLHEDRSRRTADRLVQLRRRMAAETSMAAVQRLAADIQGVMTEENLDWSGVIEFQDLEMIL